MRIKNYQKDLKVTGNDKWIGSDFNNAWQTKNFTADLVAEYFNSNQVIDIYNNLRYYYQTIEGSDVRDVNGSISFETEIGPTVSFSSITEFILSNNTVKQIDVKEFINFLEGSRIIISKAGTPNIFGYFNLLSVETYIPDDNFMRLTVEYVGGNGSFIEDEDFIFSLVDFPDTLTTETDPIFQTWLDTNPLDGFLTEEVDPIFAEWLLTNPLGDFLTEETDPVFSTWLSTNPFSDYITLNDANDLFYPLNDNPSGYISQEEVLEYDDLTAIQTAHPIGVAGTIYIANNNATTGIPVYYIWNGTSYVTTPPPVTGITGSGTINRIVKYLTPTTIGNSIMFENGTRIGIGTQNPVSVLSITDTQNQAFRGLTMSMHNSSRSGSLINFRKSRGTETAPLVPVSGDYTGLYFMYNYDGSQYIANGSFGYYVNGTVAANNIQGEWF